MTELTSTMTPREIATQAAEAIRALNHLTYRGGELGSPDEVRDIIASLGLMGPEIRLPMTPMEPAPLARLEAVMKDLGLYAGAARG